VRVSDVVVRCGFFQLYRKCRRSYASSPDARRWQLVSRAQCHHDGSASLLSAGLTAEMYAVVGLVGGMLASSKPCISNTIIPLDGEAPGWKAWVGMDAIAPPDRRTALYRNRRTPRHRGTAAQPVATTSWTSRQICRGARYCSSRDVYDFRAPRRAVGPVEWQDSGHA
jgi:hypothetical protein